MLGNLNPNPHFFHYCLNTQIVQRLFLKAIQEKYYLDAQEAKPSHFVNTYGFLTITAIINIWVFNLLLFFMYLDSEINADTNPLS